MSRLAMCVALTCSALAAASSTAAAGSQRQFGAEPSCEELLSLPQAARVMGEDKAGLVRDDFQAYRFCAYYGGSKALGHTLGIEWGPYAPFRKQFVSGDVGKAVCSTDKDACRDLKKAKAATSNQASLKLLARALERVGRVQRLQSSAFDENHAYVWHPAAGLTPFDQLSFVFVYDATLEHLLITFCADAPAPTPDLSCAIAAAKQVYVNTR